MLVDGVKWACGPCVRGHRVSTCEHHDRTLIRINRKGRPFVTCSVCNETPCPKPREHYKVQHSSRVKKTKPAPEKKITRRASSRANPACLPLAPRPTEVSNTLPTLLSINRLPDLQQVGVPIGSNASGGVSNQLPGLTPLAPDQQQQSTSRSRGESFTAPGIPLTFMYRDNQLPVPGAIESQMSVTPAVRLPPLRTPVHQNYPACDMMNSGHLLPSKPW